MNTQRSVHKRISIYTDTRICTQAPLGRCSDEPSRLSGQETWRKGEWGARRAEGSTNWGSLIFSTSDLDEFLSKALWRKLLSPTTPHSDFPQCPRPFLHVPLLSLCSPNAISFHPFIISLSLRTSLYALYLHKCLSRDSVSLSVACFWFLDLDLINIPTLWISECIY